MNIDSIKRGIVLDHIKAGKSMSIYKHLKLDKLDSQVAIIKNAHSKKMGRKDIIKIFETIDANCRHTNITFPGHEHASLYDIPLIELAQGKGEPNEALTEAIPESMLVFCGVNGALCAQVLEVIRLTKLPPIPLKAILTEDNKDWNTIQLHEELLKEKAALEEQ